MNENITAKVKEYADMKQMMNELQDLMAALEAEIKAAMGDSEEMSVGGHQGQVDTLHHQPV